MKFVLVKCKHCNYPQFVNREIKLTNCLACNREFKIVNGEANIKRNFK
jgi:predicted nucleic-acid-binding Zn-ribbon protein